MICVSYHEVTTGIESNLNEDSLSQIMEEGHGKQVSIFLEKITETEQFFVRFDEIINRTLQNGIQSPQEMFHAYEIINSMQALYGYVVHYGEQWTTDVKIWLLTMLRQKMMLPIDEPEMLVAVIHCLTRENMISSPEVIAAVNQVIEMSFDDAFDPELRNTTEGVLLR